VKSVCECACVCVSVRVRAKIMREREIKSEKCMFERKTKIGREGNSVCLCTSGLPFGLFKGQICTIGPF
jgi:hypothetical protein